MDVALELDTEFLFRARVTVSILVFVDVALERYICFSEIFGGIGFQSLFSWMSLWNEIPSERVEEHHGFQSLFSWMSLWNISYGLQRCCLHQVSILVFVDVALERYRSQYPKEDESGFQSLFSWMSLWNTIFRTVTVTLK